jgi:hypothetical protein
MTSTSSIRTRDGSFSLDSTPIFTVLQQFDTGQLALAVRTLRTTGLFWNAGGLKAASWSADSLVAVTAGVVRVATTTTIPASISHVS